MAAAPFLASSDSYPQEKRMGLGRQVIVPSPCALGIYLVPQYSLIVLLIALSW